MPIRRNWLAVATASLVYFVLGGAWFPLFMAPWLTVIGRTRELIAAMGISPAITYGTAFITTLIMAIFLSLLIAATGPHTALRGIKLAAWTWFAIVFTTWSAEYAFEARSLLTLAIITGFPLVGMLLMGAILGAWKPKQI